MKSHIYISTSSRYNMSYLVCRISRFRGTSKYRTQLLRKSHVIDRASTNQIRPRHVFNQTYSKLQLTVLNSLKHSLTGKTKLEMQCNVMYMTINKTIAMFVGAFEWGKLKDVVRICIYTFSTYNIGCIVYRISDRSSWWLYYIRIKCVSLRSIIYTTL